MVFEVTGNQIALISIHWPYCLSFITKIAVKIIRQKPSSQWLVLLCPELPTTIWSRSLPVVPATLTSDTIIENFTTWSSSTIAYATRASGSNSSSKCRLYFCHKLPNNLSPFTLITHWKSKNCRCIQHRGQFLCTWDKTVGPNQTL